MVIVELSERAAVLVVINVRIRDELRERKEGKKTYQHVYRTSWCPDEQCRACLQVAEGSTTGFQRCVL